MSDRSKPYFGKADLISGVQASLSDRFILELEGVDFALVESVGRPGYKIETESFQLMDFNIHYPKKPVFDSTVQIVIVELLDPTINATQMENVMTRLINKSFYTTPSAVGDPRNPFTTKSSVPDPQNIAGKDIAFNLSKKTLTKASTMGTTAPIVIHTLDSDGNKYDSMMLVNPMITGVAFSGLKSGGSEINKITLTVTFDYVDYGRAGYYNTGNLYDQFKQSFPQVDTALRNAIRDSGNLGRRNFAKKE